MQVKKITISVCLLLFIFLRHTTAQDSLNLHYTVYFNSNSRVMAAAGRQALEEWLRSFISSAVISKITIKGYTDSKGGNDFNYELSKQRSESVSDFFVERGVNSTGISVQYHGEAFPLASNTTVQGRRRNRRAVITIVMSQLPAAGATTDTIRQGDIGQLYDMLKTPSQEYCIDVTRDTFLVGGRGTIIQYKANTIKKEKLSCECFTLKLNEYFDNSDLVLNNLTTTSDGQLLESGGMVKLDGYCNGKQYDLKPGEFFTVMVPTDTVLPGMKLLSANRVNDADYLNWKLDPFNADLDYVDGNRMLLYCGRGGELGPPTPCPFFFCQIRDFFNGLFRERKYKSKDRRNNEESAKERDLLKKYELKGESLAVALQKSKDNAGKDALKYYVYKNYNWDYRNIDRYKTSTSFINFIVDNKPDKETDVKIIFKNSKTVVPCFDRSNSYIFKAIEANAEVWLLGLRFTINQEIYLGLQEINTSQKKTVLDFKRLSVEELKTQLQKLNK